MAAFFDDKLGGCACARSKCSDECSTYRSFKLKPKPQTNYDLLISKTPEELADYLWSVKKYDRPYDKHISSWLRWLKSPAKEGE